MQAAEVGRRLDRTRHLDLAVIRHVAVQRRVAPRFVVVGGELRENLSRGLLPHHNDVVEALAAKRAEQTFDVDVLKGRLVRAVTSCRRSSRRIIARNPSP